MEVNLWYSTVYDLRLQAKMDLSLYGQLQDIFKDTIVFTPKIFMNETDSSPILCQTPDTRICGGLINSQLLGKPLVQNEALLKQRISEQCLYKSIKHSEKSMWFYYIEQLMDECILEGDYAANMKPVDPDCQKKVVDEIFDDGVPELSLTEYGKCVENNGFSITEAKD